jgi:hypothetical protein
LAGRAAFLSDAATVTSVSGAVAHEVLVSERMRDLGQLNFPDSSGRLGGRS